MNGTTDPGTGDIAVHVVDDDPAIRDSLAWLLTSCGLLVTVWASGEDFLAAWSAAMRGCVVLDVRMGGLSGLDVLARLAAAGSLLPVIVLTGHGDVPLAVRSLKHGAFDFMEKPFDPAELTARVRAALDLETRRHADHLQARDLHARLDSLSPREREVMELMLGGSLNKQIADEIGIALRTVELHRARILEKFAVRSAVELAGRLAEVRRDERRGGAPEAGDPFAD
ncbi:response regulator transcription factor [Siculibacillus lacustris]|uniref:Response regulator transcription factor n=1 Tax=Siculibacillus lacustris TaxID=1549641 RepID=A0A4Q9VHI3_9HYPH|nr:response regulator [Siculibacillus lacustris]TBW34607.1 response regulator transcription factor [Siculibacillus lacustris]